MTTKTLAATDLPLTAAESRTAILRFTGVLTADVLVTTLCQGFTFVENLCSGAFNVTFTNALTYGGAGVGTPVTIPQGGGYVVASDAVNGSRLVLPTTGTGAATAGRIGEFPGTTVPTGWLKANGALVSRASYSALWAFAAASGNLQTDANWVANSMYGCFSSGDGSTTFRLPDLRGYFRRGWADDATGNQDYGRTCGTYQDQSVANHIHPVTVTDAGHRHFSFNVTDSVSGPFPTLTNANYPIYRREITSYYSNYTIAGNTTAPTIGLTSLSVTGITAVTTNNTGGTAQNRPQNVALMVCISYL
jgi:microcystin-dependent protein